MRGLVTKGLLGAFVIGAGIVLESRLPVAAQGGTGAAAQSAPVPISTAAVEKDGIRCRSEMVPMRDGTMLATDIYMPPSPGPHPVILQRTPYGYTLGHGCFANTSGQMAFWAQNGYVGITQDARGTFRSHGTFQPFVQEQADGYDAVEWAAKQQWSNGKVAMTGSSYFGVTQWQAAVSAPPHLVAIAPSVTSTDYHDHWTYVNGVFDLWFAQSWLLAFFAPDQYQRQAIARGMAAEDARKAADEVLERQQEEDSRGLGAADSAWRVPRVPDARPLLLRLARASELRRLLGKDRRRAAIPRCQGPGVHHRRLVRPVLDRHGAQFRRDATAGRQPFGARGQHVDYAGDRCAWRPRGHRAQPRKQRDQSAGTPTPLLRPVCQRHPQRDRP